MTPILRCPECGAEGPEDGPDEVVREKFYRLKHPGYWVCIACNRRFSTKSNLRVS